MSETASRRLFLIEMLLALPAIVVLTPLAIGMAGWAAIVVGSLPSQEQPFDRAILLMLLTGGVAGLGGLVAMVKLIAVAVRFWRDGRIGLSQERRRFWQGLVFALPALGMMMLLISTANTPQGLGEVTLRLYVSGLVLLVPVIHLWLELRRGAATP